LVNLVLREIRNSNEPFSTAALSEKLDIDRAALEGMLLYCVRKGFLLENHSAQETKGMVCASGGCGASCPGLDQCTFVARMPKIYTVANTKRK